MRIGVITEGHSDRAVIINIISGATNLDESDFQPLLPQYKYDATDQAARRGEIHGGWNAVKDECEKRIFINEFLSQEGNDFLVIHFDTAESAQYGINQPQKGQKYSEELRHLVKEQILTWLGEDLSHLILFAIAIEETDAWILTIIEDRDSSISADPKKRLEFKKGYRPGKMKPDYDLYLNFSKEFKTGKAKDIEKYLLRNKSLKDFYDEIKTKVVPLL